ncbi:MAG: class I SAM-dependent methyltransferase, partial [Alphaproteobacteria bacterium]|nr:class I SAM-dependent methyltransferase [Alphaproteobacteria bacterium]
MNELNRHPSLKDIVTGLYQGRSLTRILMNFELSKYKLIGKVVDIGGARNPDYYKYINIREATVEPLDGLISGIDFEVDDLPYADKSIDSIVCCNLLEHIFDNNRLMKEMYRVLAPSGSELG